MDIYKLKKKIVVVFQRLVPTPSSLVPTSHGRREHASRHNNNNNNNAENTVWRPVPFFIFFLFQILVLFFILAKIVLAICTKKIVWW